jgi:6-pyruvoyltetrahydropterin/6-carboxytetrahydropterin synthase
MMLKLTKRFTFEMAHALPTYPGKCHNIHGHSYKLFVTVQGTPCQQAGDAPDGMLIDFGRIKEIVIQRIVEPFDHALVLPRQAAGDNPSDTQLGAFAAKIIWVDFTPTTENLLLHFAHLLEGAFPSGTTLHSLKLYETESSCAELIL